VLKFILNKMGLVSKKDYGALENEYNKLKLEAKKEEYPYSLIYNLQTNKILYRYPEDRTTEMLQKVAGFIILSKSPLQEELIHYAKQQFNSKDYGDLMYIVNSVIKTPVVEPSMTWRKLFGKI